jgi:enamine deaminase RidA (YjgF/YER057c/UK114 family)
MPAHQLLSPAELPAPIGFSHVADVPAGVQVWVSGQMGLDGDGQLVSGGLEAQTRASFTNVGRALRSAGLAWSDVFKVTIFVLDARQIATIRKVREEFVDTNAAPASTLVQVGGLVVPGALIEIEAVALRP